MRRQRFQWWFFTSTLNITARQLASVEKISNGQHQCFFNCSICVGNNKSSQIFCIVCYNRFPLRKNIIFAMKWKTEFYNILYTGKPNFGLMLRLIWNECDALAGYVKEFLTMTSTFVPLSQLLLIFFHTASSTMAFASAGSQTGFRSLNLPTWHIIRCKCTVIPNPSLILPRKNLT